MLFVRRTCSNGVVTTPMPVRDGINVFLDGYIPTENIRFRPTSFTFRIQQFEEEKNVNHIHYNYPSMKKTYGDDFRLNIVGGGFSDSEIIVMIGENGTGKTTFIRMLAGLINVDNIVDNEKLTKFCVSYKPQIINPKFPGTVRELFYAKIKTMFLNPQFNSDVIKPLNIETFIDNKVLELSGGEMQRVALALCLGKPADIYLIDEPSAYLDSEQRIIVSKIIKQFIMHSKKTAFIVEHDFIMTTYLADKVILFNGTPSVNCQASSPRDLSSGMNSFLAELDITFRRDSTNHRPRINKLNSIKDREQKSSGNYFSC